MFLSRFSLYAARCPRRSLCCQATVSFFFSPPQVLCPLQISQYRYRSHPSVFQKPALFFFSRCLPSLRVFAVTVSVCQRYAERPLAFRIFDVPFSSGSCSCIIFRYCRSPVYYLCLHYSSALIFHRLRCCLSLSACPGELTGSFRGLQPFRPAALPSFMSSGQRIEGDSPM